MSEEIPLTESSGLASSEEEKNLFLLLEEKVNDLLAKYQGLMKEKERLAVELDTEREKRIHLEKRMELLSQDREKVKLRIDQLLHRLRSIEL